MNGVSPNDKGHTLVINTSVYSLEAVKKASYKFADRASVMISPGAAGEIAVTFHFKNDQNHDQILADFYVELLDQDLREIVKRDTVHVRNLILAHAFSRTSLVNQE